jgi:hypothetical protein
MRHHIPKLDYLMLVSRQLSPPAGLHPVLLDGLKHPTLQSELHHPQSPTPHALHLQLLSILIQRDLLSIHKLHGHRLQHLLLNRHQHFIFPPDR